ncbi:MAG: N-6 DNA methylase [Candidatus Sericytochromatia bacterium]
MPQALKAWFKDCQTVFLQLSELLSENAARSLLLQILVLKWERPEMQTQAEFRASLKVFRLTPCNLSGQGRESDFLQLEWQSLPEQMWLNILSQPWLLPSHQSLLTATAPIALLPEQLQSRSQRQQKGVFYTPQPLVDYLCKGALELYLHQNFEISKTELHSLLWTGQISPAIQRHSQALLQALAKLKICDPACGGGTLLVGILGCLQTLEKQLGPAKSHVNWLSCLYGVELDPLAAALTRWRLWKCSGSTVFTPPHIIRGNPLTATFKGWSNLKKPEFDLILANPPYIGEKGHKDLFDDLRKGPLGHFYQARSDMAYYFFHLALEWSKNSGISAFLSTNYFLTASHAQTLRDDLKKRGVVHKLTDFHEWRLFKGAQGQHNLVSLFEKATRPHAPCQLLLCTQKGIAPEKYLAEVLAQDQTFMKHTSISQNQLYSPLTGQMQQPIRLEILDQSLERILLKLQTLPSRLKDHAQLHQGIVSGADHLTLKHQQQFSLSGTKGEGIFILNQAEITKLGLSERELQLLRPWYKNSDISPWLCASETNQVIIYTDRESTLSAEDRLYHHLERFRPLLEKRREVAQGRLPWWQVHWPRQTQIFEGPKLVIPQRHSTSLAAWNRCPWYASADVYFITSKAAPERLYALLAWLNSPLSWLWLSCQGKRKGKLLELYSQPLSELPIIPGLWSHALFEELSHRLFNQKAPSPGLQNQIWELFFEALAISETDQQALFKTWKPNTGSSPLFY